MQNGDDKKQLSERELQIKVFRLALLALMLVVHMALQGLLSDHSYFNLRMANNLISAGSASFNPHTGLLTSVAPLWVLLASAWLWVSNGSLAGLSLLTAFASWGTALFAARIVRLISKREDFQYELIPALLVTSLLIVPSVQLTETPLALLLCFVGLWSYYKQRATAFAYLTLAGFTRPELFIVMLVCAAENHIMCRVSTKACLVGIFGVALPMLAATYLSFGSIVPRIIYAAGQSGLGALGFVASTAKSLFGAYLFTRAPLILGTLVATLTILTIFFSLRHLYAPDFVARDQRNALIATSSLAIFVAYALLGVPLHVWTTPLFMAPALLSLFIASQVKEDKLLTVIFVLLALPCAFNLARELCATLIDPSYFSGMPSASRAQAFRAVGQALQSDCPDCVVITSDAGSLGSAYPGVVHETSGLTTLLSPSEADLISARKKILLMSQIKTLQPGAIAGNENFFDLVRTQREFRSQYLKIMHSTPSKQPLLVYIRKRIKN
ncbi:MAG: hypothetical protein K1X79_00125 [Oligoflexia bacterium]|nr:hypothetical protein [Oligoflexia bacterium]